MLKKEQMQIQTISGVIYPGREEGDGREEGHERRCREMRGWAGMGRDG